MAAKKMTNLDRESLLMHASGKPGKIEIAPTKPLNTQRDLALAYSPGVAAPCLAIADDPADPDTLYVGSVFSSLAGFQISTFEHVHRSTTGGQRLHSSAVKSRQPQRAKKASCNSGVYSSASSSSAIRTRRKPAASRETVCLYQIAHAANSGPACQPAPAPP